MDSIITSLITVFIFIFLSIVLVQAGWTLFMVPVFDLDSISITESFGLVLLSGLLKGVSK